MQTVSKITAAFAAATMLASSAAYAGGNSPTNPSVVATANAVVVTPALIAESVQLSFGTFSASPTAGGTIDSSGNVTGSVYKVAAGTPATFVTAGAPNDPYTIVGDPTVTLNASNTHNGFMTAALTYPATRTFDSTGNDSFQVSGLLTVNIGQAADTYTGNYNVSVHY